MYISYALIVKTTDHCFSCAFFSTKFVLRVLKHILSKKISKKKYTRKNTKKTTLVSVWNQYLSLRLLIISWVLPSQQVEDNCFYRVIMTTGSSLGEQFIILNFSLHFPLTRLLLCRGYPCRCTTPGKGISLITHLIEIENSTPFCRFTVLAH